MDNEELGGILRDLVMLSRAQVQVLLFETTPGDYEAMCNLVYARVAAAFPSDRYKTLDT